MRYLSFLPFGWSTISTRWSSIRLAIIFLIPGFVMVVGTQLRNSFLISLLGSCSRPAVPRLKSRCFPWRAFTSYQLGSGKYSLCGVSSR